MASRESQRNPERRTRGVERLWPGDSRSRRHVRFGMMLGWAIVFCSFSPTGRAQSEEKPADSLERTARDLRALQAISQKRESLPGPDDRARLPVPELFMSPNPAVQAPPPSKPEQSETWLQDALNFTKEDKLAAGRSAARTESSLRKTSETPSVDPLKQYLNQWLSPRDLELLQAQRKQSLTLEGEFGAGERAGDVRALEPTQLATTPAGLTTLDPTSRPSNPYLADAAAASAPSSNAADADRINPAVRSSTDSSRPTFPGDRAGGLSTGGTTQPAFAGPPAGSQGLSARPPEKVPPAYAPPTAPVVDDRKYFPQLRRF